MDTGLRFLSEYTDVTRANDFEILTESVSTDSGNVKKYKIRGPYIMTEVQNRNGRIYPKPIIEREVNNFNEKMIKTKRSVGECFTYDDFEVLTIDGWKKYTDLQISELIATANIETGIIEYNPIEALIERDHDGIVYNIFNARGINSTVTPKHKFLIETRYGHVKLVEAEELYKNRTMWNKAKILKGRYQISHDEVMTEDEYWYYAPEKKLPRKLFAALYGIWLAEGGSNGTSVMIYQKKPEICTAIDNLIQECGFTENYKVKTNLINGCKTFTIYDKDLAKYFKSSGNIYTKRILPEIKNHFTAVELEEIIDWFIMGDGRNCKKYTKNPNYHYGLNRRSLFSVSKELVDDFQEILVKIGGSGKISIQVSKKDYFFGGHLVQIKNKKPLYILNLSTVDNISLDNRFLKIEQQNYTGKVFCLTVKNSNFYVRDKGNCYWSGNCEHPAKKELLGQITMERGCHLIESLEMDGNSAIGTSRILEDLPLGKIVKTYLDEGIQIGVSTRGFGTVDKSTSRVNENFKILTVDVVHDPSAYNAYVEAICENTEFIINDDVIVERAVENLKADLSVRPDAEKIRCALFDFIQAVRTNSL